MAPLRPGLPQALPSVAAWPPSPPGVAGGSLASRRAELDQREQWLNHQLQLLQTKSEELNQRTTHLQRLHDDRARRLKAAVLDHKRMLEEAEKGLKQREAAAEKMTRQTTSAAIQSLNEADAILASARSSRDKQATHLSERDSNGPPYKKPRGSAGF